MKFLTSADVLEVIRPTGVSPKRFRVWCDRGVIAPAEGGGRQGTYRRFTLMQAVGLAVAAKVFAGERGCSPAYVGEVVGAFAGTPEPVLMTEFDMGRTHFISTHNGRPLLGGPQYDWVDVQQTYREVLATVAAIEARLTKRPTGSRLRELSRRGARTK